MKDMNIAKLTTVDLPLFNGIVSDLFPGVDTPTIDYSKVSSCEPVVFNFGLIIHVPGACIIMSKIKLGFICDLY